jgi:hypothetical protein
MPHNEVIIGRDVYLDDKGVWRWRDNNAEVDWKTTTYTNELQVPHGDACTTVKVVIRGGVVVPYDKVAVYMFGHVKPLKPIMAEEFSEFRACAKTVRSWAGDFRFAKHTAREALQEIGTDTAQLRKVDRFK